MAMITEVGRTVASVAGALGPAIVGVESRAGVGSGIVIGAGRVLTNAHNVRSDSATVTFADGRRADATVVGSDVEGDLAVLDVDTGGSAAAAWAGDELDVGIGTPVFGVANPGGRGLRVTFGFVSGTQRSFRGPGGRRIEGSIEHTAPLLPGSSGGPIVDEGGRLLGLNTHRLGEGFYLAIPADASLRRRVDALARGESASRPRLGIAVAGADVAKRLRRAVGLAEADGALVRAVEEGSPAASAGLREGDLIVEAAGRAVAGVDELHAAVEAAEGRLPLRVLRGAEELTIEVELGA